MLTQKYWWRQGVNLSGGQRHRVALARACYQSCDVNLLDDPLSAVDAHVGRQLFDQVVCGVLAGTTRVLVTHQVQYIAGELRACTGMLRVCTRGQRMLSDAGQHMCRQAYCFLVGVSSAKVLQLLEADCWSML